MGPDYRFIILLISFLGFGAGLEFYTWRALKSKWNDYKRWYQSTLKITYFSLLIISLFSMLMLFALGDYFSRAVINFWFAFVLINWVSKLFFSFWILLDDLRRLGIWMTRKFKKKKVEKGEKITRSDFLVKTGTVMAAIPLFGLSWGMIAGPYRYRIFSEKLSFANLPSAFQGLKIVQISDIHSGSFYNKEAVNKGIDLILAQKPDIIFFTGDIVNDRAEEMDPYLDIFSRIKAPLGVYSILGNHDYGDYVKWESDEAKQANNLAVREIHKKLGWRLLVNEHVYIEKDGEKIALIGVENWGQGFHQFGDLDLAADGCQADFKILLSHDPTHWDEKVRKDHKDIDITLSGHTHGAQIGIETHGFKWSPVSLRYDKWAGLYQEENQYLYVNRGFGFIGYPGRLGIMPEITVLELNRS